MKFSKEVKKTSPRKIIQSQTGNERFDDCGFCHRQIGYLSDKAPKRYQAKGKSTKQLTGFKVKKDKIVKFCHDNAKKDKIFVH
jgi:hypothetical protein